MLDSLDSDPYVLPEHGARKRNSGCLTSVAGGNNSLFPLREVGCYPQGGYRKTRRFTESGQNTHQRRSLYDLPRNQEFAHFGQAPRQPDYNKGVARRSSLYTPKTSWPGSDIPDRKGEQSNVRSFGFNSLHNFQDFSLPKIGSLQNVLSSTQGVDAPRDHPDILVESKTEGPNLTYLQNGTPRLSTEIPSSDVPLNFVKKGAWTKEEDELLIQYGGIATNKNWTEIAEKIPGRSAKQCRERWCFNLDPSIKKELWNPDEDLLLIRKQNEIGNKWAQIAQLLPGRTENAVKTRFKSIVRARRREWRPSEDQLLLELHKELGANWEGIAAQMESHRTKHAVKMRFKELQAGLINLKLPEWGSARQTVREAYYPSAILPGISVHYQRQASGTSLSDDPTPLIHNTVQASVRMPNGPVQVKRESEQKASERNNHFRGMVNMNIVNSSDLKRECDSFDQTFEDFFSVMYPEDEPFVLA